MGFELHRGGGGERRDSGPGCQWPVDSGWTCQWSSSIYFCNSIFGPMVNDAVFTVLLQRRRLGSLSRQPLWQAPPSRCPPGPACGGHRCVSDTASLSVSWPNQTGTFTIFRLSHLKQDSRPCRRPMLSTGTGPGSGPSSGTRKFGKQCEEPKWHDIRLGSSHWHHRHQLQTHRRRQPARTWSNECWRFSAEFGWTVRFCTLCYQHIFFQPPEVHNLKNPHILLFFGTCILQTRVDRTPQMLQIFPMTMARLWIQNLILGPIESNGARAWWKSFVLCLMKKVSIHQSRTDRMPLRVTRHRARTIFASKEAQAYCMKSSARCRGSIQTHLPKKPTQQATPTLATRPPQTRGGPLPFGPGCTSCQPAKRRTAEPDEEASRSSPFHQCRRFAYPRSRIALKCIARLQPPTPSARKRAAAQYS